MGRSYQISTSVAFCISFYKKKMGGGHAFHLCQKGKKRRLSHPPNIERVGPQNTSRRRSATRTISKIQFSTKYKFLGDRWGKMFYPVCIRFSLFFQRITTLQWLVGFCHTTRTSLNYIYKLYTGSLLSLYYIFCIGITGFLLVNLRFPASTVTFIYRTGWLVCLVKRPVMGFGHCRDQICSSHSELKTFCL